MRFIANTHRVFFSLRFNEINWRSPRTIAIITAIVLLLGAGVYKLITGGAPLAEEPTRTRQVELASIGNLGSDTAPLPVVGQVTSATEADVRAEGGGRVTGVYAKLGDYVSAGRIIAETENSAQRAAVLQAEGALDSARAQAAKAEAGARSEERDITLTSAESAATALAQSKTAAVNTIKSVYGSNADVVRSRVDALFSNPRSVNPQFNLVTSDRSQVMRINSTRADIEALLNGQEARAAQLSESSDLDAELTRAQTETRKVRDFVDSVADAVSKAIPVAPIGQAEISGYAQAVSMARAIPPTSLASLNGVAQDLNGKQTALITGQKQLQQTQSGARPEDLAAANAATKQAQGAYNATLSALEKTRVRAPISGTLNSFSLSVGDFLAPAQQVAVIANNNALEVVAYITEEDRSNVIVGNRATIEGKYKGVVTKVAGAIDPTTRKIEVRIALPDNTPALTNGQSVRVEVARTVTTDTTATEDTPIAIPLSAVKIEADRTLVFTLDASSTLIAHEVTLGPLMGDKIEVRSGVTPDMNIVIDARGLKEGQRVIVKQ